MFDILAAIEDAEMIIADTQTLDDYRENRVVQLAIERLLSIIGEATGRLENEGSSVLPANIRQIKGLRNRIIHEHDGLDETMIWQTIHESLPKLKQEIQNMLEEDTDLNQ